MTDFIIKINDQYLGTRGELVWEQYHALHFNPRDVNTPQFRREVLDLQERYGINNVKVIEV